MKKWIGFGVIFLALVFAVLFGWPKSRGGPEAIVYGRDVCDHCRMHITRPGFAAELRNPKGALTKYDDIGCMLRSMKWAHREFPEAWVEDHGKGEFVSLLTATFVRGKELGTPMGYDILAFKAPEEATAFAKAHSAEVVPLEVLLKTNTVSEAHR